MNIDTRNNSKVAIIGKEFLVHSTNDALDLMANVQYNGCNKFIIGKENFSDDFFDLKSKIAGEILQKYTNYRVAIAIVGDYSVYNSKSLKDFIYECNKGKHIFFENTTEDALDTLHNK